MGHAQLSSEEEVEKANVPIENHGGKSGASTTIPFTMHTGLLHSELVAWSSQYYGTYGIYLPCIPANIQRLKPKREITWKFSTVQKF